MGAHQHFGPNIGIAVVDNLFGMMQVSRRPSATRRPLPSADCALRLLQGAQALVLAQQKLWWMNAASKYSVPVGAALGLFLGQRLADFCGMRAPLPPQPQRRWR